MKKLLYLIPLTLVGCVSGPERLTETKFNFVHGTNHITLSTPKEYKIKKLKLNEKDGLEIEGLVSTVNAGAVEAQTAQADMMNQLMVQNAAMLQQFGNLAAQYFSGGVVRGNAPTIQIPMQGVGSAASTASSTNLFLSQPAVIIK